MASHEVSERDASADGVSAHPPELLAIVVADGDTPSRDELDAAWPGWSAGATWVVAADGGARGAERLGLPLDRIVGDGDSLGAGDLERFGRQGIPIDLSPAEKDESDTELAMLAAIDLGATAIVVLGAFGGPRLDHTLANVGILALSALGGRPCVLLDGRTRVSLLRGPGSVTLVGRGGDIVSLLPFGSAVEGVTTDGLRYPLRDEPLPAGPARGLSNVRLGPTCGISVRQGHLLIVESPATLLE
jgi:thiamine pyrophosphokinase